MTSLLSGQDGWAQQCDGGDDGRPWRGDYPKVSRSGGYARARLSSELITKPLEERLEAKYPLKDRGVYVLHMDNPYLLLNRQAFEAVGV